MVLKHIVALAVTAGVAVVEAGLPNGGTAVVSAEILWTKPICKETDRYIGWPTVCLRTNGELLAAFSGDRDGHVCPFGKVQLVRSTDGGETWSGPETVRNSCIDDRDAGLIELKDGTLLLNSFSSTCFSTFRSFRRIAEKIPEGDVRRDIGYWSLRSADGGRTWGELARMRGFAPHGGIQLRDGRVLVVGRRHNAEGNMHPKDPENVGRIHELPVEASADGGRSWQVISRIVPQPPYKVTDMHEPHVVELPDGALVVQIRCHSSPCRTVQCESADGGRTWGDVHETGIAGFPAHLIRLRDGRLLSTYARRDKGHFGEYAVLSSDGGKSWDNAHALRISSHFNGDLGYPSTVQLADGSLITVYYQAEREGEKPCLMATKWKLFELQQLVDRDATVRIPAREEPYRITSPLYVPATRRIEATGATIELDCAGRKATEHVSVFAVTGDVARLEIVGLTFASPAATHPFAHLVSVSPIPERSEDKAKVKLGEVSLTDVTVKGTPPRELVHAESYIGVRVGDTRRTGHGSAGPDMRSRLVNDAGVKITRLKAPEAVRLPPKDRVHVYLLMGQSNMAGYGAVPEQPFDLSRVVALSREGLWIPAREPLHFDEWYFDGGVGPAASFARAAARAAPDAVIALVPCAQGATGSGQWRKGAPLYEAALRRARVALRDGTLKGVLWHQGEADSYGEAGAKAYGAFLRGLVRDLREEFGSPDLPFVAGGLGEMFLDEHVAKSGKHRFWRTVLEETRQAMEETPHCGFASAAGLPHRGDLIHFSAESQRELGIRFAQAMGLAK